MAGHTDNSVVIDAPLDLVWDLTNDVARWPDLFSEYAEATILEQRPDGSTSFRLSLHPDENGTVWSWVSVRSPDPDTRTVRSQRVETGVFKYMSLFWEYTEVAGGVRMRWVQDFEMKAAAPIDDAAMTERLNRNTLVQQDLIKRKIEAAARQGVPAR